MSLRSAIALHVNMTAAFSPWMFRFELAGVLRQKSVANCSNMLWSRRGFNSQMKEQLIKTRRTNRESEESEIRSALQDRFVMGGNAMLQEIGFGSYVDSLNSKASALSSLVEGLDTGPDEQPIPFACKCDLALAESKPVSSDA